MEASEVFGLIRELVWISRLPGEALLSRAYVLMGKLRDCGFSGSEISLLVGGRWGDSAVRRFGKGSGVVDVSGKEALMSVVGEFAAGGGDLADIAGYKEAKRVLSSVGLDFEEVRDLAVELSRCHGTVASVSELSSALDGAGRTVGEVSQRIGVDRELQGLGLTREFQLRLLGAAKIIGEPETILGAIIMVGEIQELHSRQRILRADIERLGVEKASLESQIREWGDMIDAAGRATLAGFTAASLVMVVTLSEKLGGPSKAVDAIQQYKSLKAIDDELDAKTTELERVNKETSEGLAYLHGLEGAIDHYQREYDRNEDVRVVVELLTNPLGFTHERSMMSKLLANALDNGAERMEKDKWNPTEANPEWDKAIVDLRGLANRLRGIAKVNSPKIPPSTK